MTLLSEHALTALAAYAREAGNIGPPPQGWSIYETSYFSLVGFHAVALRRDGTNEIVIAYSGTDSLLDWATGNATSALGIFSPQLQAAIQFYSDIRQKMSDDGIPSSEIVTLTGHSLGGGLASVVSVFFDQRAETFNTAPFEASVYGVPGISKAAVRNQYLAYAAYQLLKLRPVSNAFTLFQTASAWLSGGNPLFAPREANVDAVHIYGEALQWLRLILPTIVDGESEELDTPINTLGPVDLHSQALLAALEMSPTLRAALSNAELSISTLELLFDTTLYAVESMPSDSERDFLMDLIRNQLGVDGTANTSGNNLLNIFAQDLQTISQAFASTHISTDMASALIAATMDYYYHNDFLNGGTPQPFVQTVPGGFHLDFTLVDATSGQIGRERLIKEFATGYPGSVSGPLRDMLDISQHWYIQTGSSPLNATGSSDRDVFVTFTGLNTLDGGGGDDLMLGGSGVDNLSGGIGQDRMTGGLGDDVLNGGQGNDRLFGGAGFDNYDFVNGDGLDQVDDSDGAGQIRIGGAPIAAGQRIAPNRWRSADGIITIERREGQGGVYDLMLRSTNGSIQISVRNWTNGELGITLDDTPIDESDLPGNPPTTLTIMGDRRIADSDPGTPGVQPTYDALGNPITESVVEAVADVLFGSVDADKIVGGDLADRLHGNGGNDLLYAAGEIAVADAIVTGRNGLGVGEMISLSSANGDNLLSGQEGDDVLVGSSTNDLLSGGAGNDLLIAGQGDDFIDADTTMLAGSSDWTLVESPVTTPRFTFAGSGIGLFYSDGGSDVVHAGGGNDAVIAGGGDDVVHGDDGDDDVYGGSGEDTVFGDAGNDTVYGDFGNFHNPLFDQSDYIDGGAGNDSLYGNGAADILIGGADNDLLVGDSDEAYSGDDYLDGESGNDTLHGRGGADTLIGGTGIDNLIGDDPASAVGVQGNDWLDGGADNDFLWGAGGSDTLLGGSGNDQLMGDSQDTPVAAQQRDLLFGELGDDYLYGFGGNDGLDGGDGNDYLVGGAGDDVLEGWIGNDTLYGDDDNSQAGLDQLYGGEGSDSLYGYAGNDRLYGEAGTDTLAGGDGDDVLEGGDGDDWSATGSAGLYGDGGNDILRGGAGKDRLQGGDGDDRLEGGGGNDVLFGGAGDDTYVLNIGDGQTQITDSGGSSRLQVGDGNGSVQYTLTLTSNGFIRLYYSATDYAFMDKATFDNLVVSGGLQAGALDPHELFQPGSITNHGIRLNAGVNPTEVSYLASDDDLVIAYSGTVTDWVQTSTLINDGVMYEVGDGTKYGLAASVKVLVLTNWYTAPVINNYVFRLEDSTGQLIDDFGAEAAALPRQHVGTAAAEFLGGTSTVDVMTGGAGQDHLDGGDADDDLSGGADGDFLVGGGGNDTYRFNTGDGSDVIFDVAGSDDVLRFGPGITAGMLTVTESNDGLQVQVGSPVNQDNVLIAGWSQGGAQSIDRFVFDDSSSLTREQIDALNTGNHSPRSLLELPDLTGRIGQELSYTVPAGTFSDPGDTLTYSARLADGSDLPSWLNFNPSTRQFTGTPPGGSIGTLDVEVRVVDAGGLANFVNLNISVTQSTTLMGSAGPDWITSSGSGAFDLYGLSGDDELDGHNGDDRLFGGLGADELSGGQGNDTYFYRRGDGHDTISQTSTQAGQVERLIFDVSIAVSDVVFTSNSNGDLLIGFKNADGLVSQTDSIRVIAALQPNFPEYALDQIIFESDGTILTPTQLSVIPTQGDDYIRGTSGNDTIYGDIGYDFLFGEDGDDTLSGGVDNDTLTGGAGSDTYMFGRNEGVDTISNVPDSAPGSIDVLKFATGISPTDVRVLANGGSGSADDFEVQVLGAGGVVETTVKILGARNETTGAHILDEVRFTGDSTVWTLADLRAFSLVPTNGNDTISGFSTADTMLGGAGEDYLSGNGGNDTLRGEAGNDQLNGGAGDDTYRFGYGQGYDEINDTSGTNQLQLDTGILPANVSLYRISSRGTLLQSQDATTNDDLMVVLNGSNQQILIEGYFNGATPRPINQIVFGDGSIWNTAAIDSNTVNLAGTINAMTGTAGNDNFSVDHYADTIAESSAGGTDSVTSSVTYTLPVNVEDLILTGTLNLGAYGNSGSNVLTGNAGANYLDGTANGFDVLQGGTGDDTYRVYHPNFVSIVEDVNSGYDTVLVSYPDYQAPANVERIVLIDDASNWQMSFAQVRGNALDNIIDARTPNNSFYMDMRIDGREGADVMYTGINAGFTTFVVDNVGDVVMNADDNDTIETSVSFSMVNGGGTLVLTGTSNITGTGNDSDNYFDRFVYSGSSTLIGGLGDDRYDITVNDTVVEAAGGGRDKVVLESTGWATTINLSSWANVEDLTHDAGVVGTTYTIHGTAEANSILGAVGHNVIHGYDGDDELRGRNGNDTLYGGAGNDDLEGSNGNDTMVGGTGDDTYDVGSVGDVVVEVVGEGIDTVESSITYTLAASLEHLTLTTGSAVNGTGNSLDNVLTGGWGTNTLTGLGGNDTLDSQGGGDTLIGGIGNDVYRVWSSTDVIVENAGEGYDVVYVDDGDYTMGANVEDLVIAAWGTSDATGNAQANVMTGNDWANRLDGGAGNDTLIGGLGDDTYVIDSVGDTIVEALDGGTDTVETHLQWTLAAATENLVLTGSAAVNGTGSAQDNALTGNAGANSLFGLGGNDVLYGAGGADILTGGSGNDVYLIEDAADTIVELADEGIDLVRSSVSHALAANVENLELTAWTGDSNATGNALDNHLIGNEGNNRLEGGAGADRMDGGYGDDTYVVDAFDTLSDVGFGNLDTVESAGDWTLGTAFERLILTGSNASNGTGSSIGNILIGNSAANRLDGAGGADTLQGGAGDDVYVVDIDTDVIVEHVGEGTDLVEAHYSTTLSANVENLTLMTNVNALDATGNSMNNTLLGNNLDNTLSGMGGNDTLNGGLGSDTLVGGLGDDTYVVDTASDTITESAGEGTDTILTSVGLTVAANVENATLTGVGASDLTGNTLNNVLTGNAAVNILNGGAGNDTLIGGAGNDIYVLDSASDVVTELAGEGTDLVQASATVTLANHVENLTLTGTSGIGGTGNSQDNVMTGNSGNNTLSGGGGNDTIDGGTGNDMMIGGTGDDSYVVNVATDVVTENAGEGTDTVTSSVTLTLAANVENLTLSGSSGNSATGNALDNVLTGNSGANTLTGLGGNDTLNGGSGNDTMVGGTGDDIYVVNASGDVVTELASEGTDTIQSSATYTASANVENLVLTGTSNINATGNALNNALTGNSGNNTLDGSTGTDTMTGGGGNDTYIVDNTADVVVELAGGGTDLVQAGATYTLSAEVENLTLTGSTAINGTGNALDNVLTGNTGANTLTGGDGDDTISGGTGNDTMVGGTGNDSYVVDVATDVITENAGEGIDSVSSAVTLTLAANVENLTLTGSSGNSATGNALNNVLTGNSGANTLDGLAGADTLIGGSGNDIYVVDSAADTVTELAGQGTDTIQSSVSLTLVAEVENLTLTGTALSGTGNTLNNTLLGNASNNTLTGLAGDDTLDGGAGTDTMLGGIGNDTYVVDVLGDIVTEVAGEGTDTIQTALAYTLGADVENLTLTGAGTVSGTGNSLNNVLTGNTANNTLTGLGGNDTLDGGTGNDTMIGGLGDDIYVVNVATDVVTEAAGEGTDTVQSAVTLTLANNVENLTLTGSSGNSATGNALNNVLTGNSGANTLSGLAGADTMIGGGGNDTYVVDDAGDVVTEAAGGGTDTVQTALAHTLAAEVENLTLTGSSGVAGTGNTGNNALTGNTGNNTLTGLAGNDTLSGGTGNDTMIGGTGDDTYVVDVAGDVVTELSGEGTDTVQSGITYTLGANVENLTLTGSSGIHGTGNSLNNVLTGNSGANTLTGNGGNDTIDGGTGNDTMIGGAGDDSYVVNAAGDVVTEAAGEGIDTITSSVALTLGANVENLTFSGSSGLAGTGNTLDNVLTGNSGANTLTGLAGNDTLNGGTGNDTMVGGTGDDIYHVNVATDVVTENAGEGTDTVNSSATLTLAANVENLTLTGSSAINGTGQALNNVLTGNTGVNTLSGLAGNDTLEGKAGNDALTGGDGADIYRFSAGDGSDTINNVAADGAIDRLVFTNITRVQLSFSRVGDDLVITRSAVPTDTVRVTGWFTATGNRLDFVDTSEGTATTAAEIDALIAGGGGSFPNGEFQPEVAMMERRRTFGSLDELMTAASKPGRRQGTEGIQRRNWLSAVWDRVTARRSALRSASAHLVEPAPTVSGLDTLLTAAAKPRPQVTGDGIRARLWSSDSMESLAPASQPPAAALVVEAESRQAAPGLDDRMAVALESPTPPAGIESHLWSTDSRGAMTMAAPAPVAPPVAFAEPRQAISALDALAAPAVTAVLPSPAGGIESRLWPTDSAETITAPAPTPAPVSVPVAEAESREAVSSLATPIVVATKLEASSAPEGITPRLWTPAEPEVVLPEVTPEPVSLPVASAEPMLVTASLDALMDLAGNKSRLTTPVCTIDNRFLPSVEPIAAAPVTALDRADAENPVRCELQLDRLVHAMASFRKLDGFDALQQSATIDGLAPGTLAMSQARQASVANHIELQQ